LLSPSFFFFNDTATTEIYTLSLHDALPISTTRTGSSSVRSCATTSAWRPARSEEHTSELQSLAYLVCRLLLEKKKNTCRRDFEQTKKNSKTGRIITLYEQ